MGQRLRPIDGSSFLSAVSLAAQLTARAGEIRGQGLASLGNSIGSGLAAVGQGIRVKRERAQDMAMRQQDHSDRLAEQARDNARQDSNTRLHGYQVNDALLADQEATALQEYQAALSTGDANTAEAAKKKWETAHVSRGAIQRNVQGEMSRVGQPATGGGCANGQCGHARHAAPVRASVSTSTAQSVPLAPSVPDLGPPAPETAEAVRASRKAPAPTAAPAESGNDHVLSLVDELTGDKSSVARLKRQLDGMKVKTPAAAESAARIQGDIELLERRIGRNTVIYEKASKAAEAQEEAAVKASAKAATDEEADRKTLLDGITALRVRGAMPTETTLEPGTLFGTPVQREVLPTTAAEATERLKMARDGDSDKRSEARATASRDRTEAFAREMAARREAFATAAKVPGQEAAAARDYKSWLVSTINVGAKEAEKAEAIMDALGNPEPGTPEHEAYWKADATAKEWHKKSSALAQELAGLHGEAPSGAASGGDASAKARAEYDALPDSDKTPESARRIAAKYGIK